MCCLSEDEKRSIAVDKEIKRILKQQKKKERREIKILLLGQWQHTHSHKHLTHTHTAAHLLHSDGTMMSKEGTKEQLIN